MSDAADASRAERVEAAANNLRVDAATAEILHAFDAAGVEARILKGPSLARWLYGDHERPAYGDCDLLVPPSSIAAAEVAIERLGFVRYFDDEGLPDWWRDHGSQWWRPDDAVVVDLHRTLPGVGVDDETAWSALTEQTETVQVAGYVAPVFAEPARTLHVALHAAQHGGEAGKPLTDLTRALDRLDLCLWREAGELAARLRATESFGAGLRLTPRGAAIAADLGLSPGTSVNAALLATTPPPVALGLEQLAAAPDFSSRVRILARKIVPPVGFIRRWHQPLASRGRSGLVLAYLYRPIWLVTSFPRAFRAWLAARRAVSRR